MAVNSVIHLSILTISDDFPILILGNIKDVELNRFAVFLTAHLSRVSSLSTPH